ncbi:MAG: cation transporting ATPase C-terminal domain-containing protein [Clostridiales bacterium]|nr:cation transporting ATPase C-terminal domain-containing protein [Clostridiales bacterium]
MKNIIEAFIRQFKDFTVILLLILAVFGGFCGSLGGFGGFADSLIVFAIVFANACFGAYQELNADRVLGKADGERPTPLQKELGEVGRGLFIITLGLCAVVFLGGLLRGGDFGSTLFLSVSLAVAVVPESLPAIVNVVLSVGVMRLDREGAAVRRLSAAESMGQIRAVFTDLKRLNKKDRNTLRKAGIKVFDITAEKAFYELWQRNEIIAFAGETSEDERLINASDVGCCFSDNENMYKYAHIIFKNPESISASVKIGREIFVNLKKAIHFLLSCNAGELLCVLSALILGLETPLLGVQLLMVNLITDCLPAIAMGFEPERDDIISLSEIGEAGIFTPSFIIKIIFEGAVIAAVSLGAFVFGLSYGSIKTGRTMIFCVLCMSQLFHSFNMRSGGFLKNKFLNFSFLAGVFAVVSTFKVPLFAELLGFCILENKLLFDAFILSALPFVFFETIKKL